MKHILIKKTYHLKESHLSIRLSLKPEYSKKYDNKKYYTLLPFNIIKIKKFGKDLTLFRVNLIFLSFCYGRIPSKETIKKYYIENRHIK